MAAKRPRTDAASAEAGADGPRVPCIVSAGADLTAVAMALTGGSARAGHGLAASTTESGGVSLAVAAAGGASSDSGSSSSSSAGLEGSDKATVLRATKPGILRFRAPDRMWVETTHKRYVPAVGDTVVGVVLERRAEAYRVDVGGSTAAFLPLLAFDGASRRNKPELPVGCMIYARVCGVDRHADAELTCQVADGPKRDWVTGESVFGELRGGTCIRLGVAFAKTLLGAACPVLAALSAILAFEIAVGCNGRVWVQSGTIADTVIAANALRNAEHMPPDQHAPMVKQLLRRARR